MVKDLVLSYWIESSVMERRKLFLSAPTLLGTGHTVITALMLELTVLVSMLSYCVAYM